MEIIYAAKREGLKHPSLTTALRHFLRWAESSAQTRARDHQIFWLIADFYPLPSLLRLERGPLLCFQGLTAISNVLELRLGFYSPMPPGPGLLASSPCDIDAKTTGVQWYGGTELRRTEPVALVCHLGGQVSGVLVFMR